MRGTPQGRPVRAVVCLREVLAGRTLTGCSTPWPQEARFPCRALV
jgi:hypothetical protein